MLRRGAAAACALLVVLLGGALVAFLVWRERAPTIVTLTTTPERLAHPTMHGFLEALLDLPCADRVQLNVPWTYHRTGEAYVIPEAVRTLSQARHLVLHRCEDEGPATKMLGALRDPRIPESAFLVALEDDQLYRPGVVCRLKDAARKLGTEGKVFSMCEEDVMGFRGFAGTKKTLRAVLRHGQPAACLSFDDVWWQWVLRIENISCVAVPYEAHGSDWDCSIRDAETRQQAPRGAWGELQFLPDIHERGNRCLESLQRQSDLTLLEAAR